MNRRLMPILVVMLLVAACSSPARGSGQPVAPPPATEQPDAAAPPATVTAPAVVEASASPTSPARAALAAGAEPSGANAIQHVQALAGEIGPRPAGTAEERRAAGYIAARLRDSGYEVELQQFPVRVFQSRAVDARVVSPTDESLRAAPLTNSRPGSASGELFDARIGQPSDYPAGGIEGRIALIQRGELTFADKVRNAAAAGASGVVMFDPPNDVIPGSLTGTLPNIPALSVGGADGVRLRERVGEGPVRVSLTFDGGIEELQATNVIGRPAGGECAAVVGGHYDSVPAAPGGSDNASGTAAVLELSRVQALRGNPERACFIAFSGEELGLLGSVHFVSQLTPEQRQAVRFMLNLDMVAVGDEWLFIGSPALQRQAQQLAADAGVQGRRADLLGASSDHASFIERKIPALMLHRSDDRLLHTPRDTADRIEAAPLETAVRLGLSFVVAFGQG